jgi:hypothetical protein
MQGLACEGGCCRLGGIGREIEMKSSTPPRTMPTTAAQYMMKLNMLASQRARASLLIARAKFA